VIGGDLVVVGDTPDGEEAACPSDGLALARMTFP